MYFVVYKQYYQPFYLMAKSIHVTSKVQQKKICYFKFIKIFLQLKKLR